MTPVLSKTPALAVGKANILVVDDEPSLAELAGDVIGRQIPCRLVAVQNIQQARQVIENEPIDLLVVDVNLPDGDGTTLLETLRARHPQAGAIVITGAPSVDRAVTALRQGAVDFVAKPFSASQLMDHVRSALARQAKQVRETQRLDRLRDAVKRLNSARKVVSKKVDLLCNDLIRAYTELSRQMDVVRTQEGFRKFISEAKDLEQLLCHAMDWMLRQLGYSNIAIWLAAEDTEFQLGAYMKFTIAGDQELAYAIQRGLLPLVVREGFIHLMPEEAQERLTEAELDYLADQAIMGANCTYLGEPLAAMILFRDADKPFTDEDAKALQSISAIFSVALASIVRGTQQYEGEGNPFSDGDTLDEENGRKSDGEWWKRGEDPPF
ncbi:MAG: response regulator [Phycisphaerales bacterium]|jgi:DNA-binding response OmpR family regulator|nr:response regulator [Phycisphaerales bacterium]